MREIKFRAWDGERLFPYMNVSEYGVGYYEYVDSPEGLKVMQYTGLKDRNGNDIYEGDIIEWVEPNRGEQGDIIDYDFPRGVVAWGDERSGFIVLCSNGNEWFEGLMNITVIGNVWDHPHLLEESK